MTSVSMHKTVNCGVQVNCTIYISIVVACTVKDNEAQS